MKVTLKKAFAHDGKAYQIGEEFEGTPGEIDALVRQGYGDPVKEEPAAAEEEPPKPEPKLFKPPDKPAAQDKPKSGGHPGGHPSGHPSGHKSEAPKRSR
jgi:hypothetical protein